MNSHSLLLRFARRQSVEAHSRDEIMAPLIADEILDEFLATTSPPDGVELNDILARAIGFALQARNQDLEVSFISLSAALESVLTFFRRQGDYDVLSKDKFGQLERDLKKWLKQHPVLKNESGKRALIYEKVPELNRFPFSYVLKKFCEQHSLDLSDLWPVVGNHADWPLTEIRHRLVHGDPFVERPPEALACAGLHLSWIVERMILCAIGWPIERSNVSQELLRNLSGNHRAWEAERAKFACPPNSFPRRPTNRQT